MLLQRSPAPTYCPYLINIHSHTHTHGKTSLLSRSFAAETYCFLLFSYYSYFYSSSSSSSLSLCFPPNYSQHITKKSRLIPRSSAFPNRPNFTTFLTDGVQSGFFPRLDSEQLAFLRLKSLSCLPNQIQVCQIHNLIIVFFCYLFFFFFFFFSIFRFTN